MGVLGIDAPEQLLNTVIYLVGMHFALRGVAEHCNLRCPGPGFNSQISFEKDSCGIECIVYREDPLQKTNQGGLTCRTKPKVVWVYPSANSERDPVAILNKYVGLLPKSLKCNRLYLRPKKCIGPWVW